jgi:hypothetical protein
MEGPQPEAPIPHPSSLILHPFRAALRGLPENPLVRREWSGLVRQMRDWRLWCGFRLPRDARGWGLPAVAWCALLPYGIWVTLRLLIPYIERRFPGYAVPSSELLDVMSISVLLLGLYVSVLAAALMAPAVTRERERETWEGLRSALASPHEIVLGLLVGRLGPLLASFLAVGLFWTLARPHYTPLLQPYGPFRLDAPQLAAAVWVIAAVAAAWGALATVVSASCRSSAQAVVLSIFAGAAFVGVVGLLAAGVPERARPGAVLLLSLGTAIAAYTLAVRRLESMS